MPPPEPVGSPLWWVQRLEKRLKDQVHDAELLGRYYEGDHPLPVAHDRAREAFQRLLRQSRANWCGLIIDAVAERLHVDGFRMETTDEAADADAWGIWQRNGMDAESELVHVEALICGESYVTVWSDPDDVETPLITAEHPTQMVIDTMPGRRQLVAAAMKVWEDDWSGETHATLYLPDGIWKYRRRSSNTKWTEREESIANPLGEVPVVPFRNRPRLLAGGRSEIDDVLDIQDRINKTILDRLMAGEFAAFRQRWATGMEIPTDDEGNAVEPFRSAVDRLWISEDPETTFGEFSATDLGPYIDAVEADVQHMAAISRTPPHYLLGKMLNISGDALKAAESGLASKAKSRTRHFGEAWEKVMRLAFAVLDDPRAKVQDSQTIWSDVETRTEGERVDALTKMATLGVPRAALWERWGASQQEIARWRDLQLEESLIAPTEEITGL